MLNKIKGELIVSCQALDEEPLHSSFVMGRMALAAVQSGAKGIRAQGVEDIIEIKKMVDVPVIGIIKRDYPDSQIYIGATQKEVNELLATGCEMIAIDATNRPRPNGEKTEDLLKMIHDGNTLAMADISTLEEAVEAERIGFDCVSTTLAGYTDHSEYVDGPNFKLIDAILKVVKIPVIAEGKIHTPEALREVFDHGVYSAVVGGAITRPQEITARFIKKLKENNNV